MKSRYEQIKEIYDLAQLKRKIFIHQFMKYFFFIFLTSFSLRLMNDFMNYLISFHLGNLTIVGINTFIGMLAFFTVMEPYDTVKDELVQKLNRYNFSYEKELTLDVKELEKEVEKCGKSIVCVEKYEADVTSPYEDDNVIDMNLVHSYVRAEDIKQSAKVLKKVKKK